MDSHTITTETDPTFLSRFFLDTDEIYSERRYLTVIMRTSIFERIFRKYLFPKTNGYISLYEYINTLTSNRRDLAKFIERLKLLQKCFPSEGPLYIFNEIAKEINRLLEQDDFSLVRFDKFILKLEFFLAWHFENNFYEKQISQQMNANFFDNMYLQKARTNFNYSVESLTTIFKFLKIFEKQSLTTLIPNDFENVNDLFCIEKIYYFYTDKAGKHKNETGNLVDYMLGQLHKKLESQNNAKVINYQLENYIMMNLFFIDTVIQKYSFYFTKKPELTNIFNSLIKLKSFPNPISTFCNEITETILNEITFQGISIINKLRESYFIDYLSENILKVNTKAFRSVVLVYSNEWDKRHYATINTENPSGFNLAKFLNRLKNKYHKKKNKVFDLREFTIKIFITVLFNNFGRVEFDDLTLRNLYNTFYPEIIEMYEDIKRDENEDVEEDQEQEQEVSENRNKTLGSLKMLLKVLDCGFDKSIKDFDKQMMLIAKKVASMKKVDPPKMKTNEEEEDEEEEEEENNEEIFNNMYTNDYLLPITSMRNYLKPQYTEINKVFSVHHGNDKNALNVFELYKAKFVNLIMNYFPHLMPEKFDFQSEDEEEQETEDETKEKSPSKENKQEEPPKQEDKKEEAPKEEEQPKQEEPPKEEEQPKQEELPKEANNKVDLKEQRLKQLRHEIYSNFRINIVLIEEQNTFVHFISNLITNIQESQSSISEKEFNHFWKYFVPDRKSIYPKFLLYILPHYESCQDNPFRLFSSTTRQTNSDFLLSEFLATQDNLYKNIVFMPWASKSDPTFFSYIPVCRSTDENIMQFPSIDTMFSFLKKPLDYYLTESSGIFNLDLYSVSITSSVNNPANKPISSLFWKNATFTIEEPSKTKIIMKCVDYLGLEQPENKYVELFVTSPLQIRIYNLFYKEDVPFNYNNTSNNGYLEVYICDKYSKDEIDKLCDYHNFMQHTADVKFYEEFNVPQMDIKTIFKNYKVKSFVIETDKQSAKLVVDEKVTVEYTKLTRLGTMDKKKAVPNFKFNFDEFKLNNEKYTIPIASFVSI